MASDFDYRFSSEVFDTETGLVYYNYRYYSAELGRWLRRVPIGEEGGVNLYAMVGNDLINNWDMWGKMSITIGGHTYNLNAKEVDISRVVNLKDVCCYTAETKNLKYHIAMKSRKTHGFFNRIRCKLACKGCNVGASIIGVSDSDSCEGKGNLCFLTTITITNLKKYYTEFSPYEGCTCRATVSADEIIVNLYKCCK
jgi:RHS repeat-associated protein